MCIDRCLVGATLLAVAACTSSSAPTTSTPISAPSPAANSTQTVSGEVLEGSQPIQGAEIENGYDSHASVLSDSNGGFQLLTNMSGNPHSWVRAIKAGYAQPCAAPIPASGPVTVQLVSQAAVNSTPVFSPAGCRTISGVVMMTDGAATQPAAGASVDFEPTNDDWPAAVTHTDSSGKFALCTLPETAVEIGVLVGNTFLHVPVPPGQMSIEVTLEPVGLEGRHR